MKKLLFSLLICVTTGTLVSGQDPGLHFSRLNDQHENSNDFVNFILRDSKGRIWIGGNTGFYHYDGAHFLTYRKSKDRGSLISNYVHSLCEDKKGNVWGGTDRGIFCFTPETGLFRRYQVPDPKSPQSVHDIVCDDDGNIWGTTYYHLLKYNPQADSFELEAPCHPQPDSLNAYGIKKRGMVYHAGSKSIWMATRSGIAYYDLTLKKWNNYLNHPVNGLIDNANAGAIAKTADGNLMYFNNKSKEIIRFDPLNKKVKKRISVQAKFPTAVGAALFESADGKIWFSGWNDDVAMIDQANGDAQYDLRSGLNEPFTLTGNFFWSAIQDDNGTIWFGTPGGISVCNPAKSLYRLHRTSKIILGVHPKATILLFSEDPVDSSWWLLTSTNHIIHYYPATGGFEVKKLSHALPDRKGNMPQTITGTSFFRGRLVVCTHEGAWVWQDAKRPLMSLSAFTGANFPMPVQKMINVDERIFYVSDRNLLIRWDSKSNAMSTVPMSKQTVPDNIAAMDPVRYYHKGRPMYVRHTSGYIAKIESDSLRPIRLLSNTRDIYSGYANDLVTDKKGNVWIEFTGIGLILYKPDGTIRVWDETDGLELKHFGPVTTDNYDNVWSASSRHYSVLLSKSNTFFYLSLPPATKNTSWYSMVYPLANGNILANNFCDLIEFFPDRLLQQPNIRTPEISAVYAGDKPLKMMAGEGIELNPDQNDLRIWFGLLTDNLFFPHLLRYKLDGADKDWKTADLTSEAVYNKLPPGAYTFRVQGISKNGEWQTQEATLEILISKPFYLTSWFVLCTAGVILAIFFGVYRYRFRQHRQIFDLETKAALLEREKATIQYDSLKQQLNPHFLFNSLTSLAGLIETDQEMASGFLQTMSDMYRYILKNGEQETVLLKDELRFGQLYMGIQQTRFGKGFQVEVDVPEEYGTFRIAPVTLQNLVENAIKHNIIDRSSPLVIRIFIDNDYLVVSNNLQKKPMVETSNKTGLNQFISLYRFLSEKPVLIAESETEFVVKVPLV